VNAGEDTLTIALTHTITAYSVKVEMSYVCAYSSVQLGKSRVEKEFTSLCSWRTRTNLRLLGSSTMHDTDHIDYASRISALIWARSASSNSRVMA